jgi:serine protease Do
VKRVVWVILASWFACWAAAGAGVQKQDTELQQALALEKTVQRIIAQAEPSIACILVSRSDLYARFGQGPSTINPGNLGQFDSEALKNHRLFGELSAADQKAALRTLDLAEGGQIPEGAGSGVIVDRKGLVLTAYHVVYGSTKIFVRLPGGQSSYADIYAADPRSDLAVLRLLTPKLMLKAIRVGDGGKAERGRFVVGLACPLDPTARATKATSAWGMIGNIRQRLPVASGTEEKGKSIHHYGTLLQTDARMNLGVSGGVLFNLQGDAIALTSTVAALAGSDVAGTFAIPFDDGLRKILSILMKGEEVEYGFLGISLDPAGTKSQGVALKAVTDGSPADLAGLKEGHLILAVDDQPIVDNDQLLGLLSTQLAGARLRLDIRRPGMTTREKVEIVLAKYLVSGKAISSHPGSRPVFRGLRVDYTSILAQQPGFAVGPIPRGVLISDVLPNTPAARADLKAGLVITHVNDRLVTAPPAFYELVLNQKGPIELILQATEKGQSAPKVTLP